MRIGALLSGLAVAAIVLLAVAGEVRRRRRARATRAGPAAGTAATTETAADRVKRTVFAAEAVEDPGADRRIDRALVGYGVGAGAMVAGAGASVAYLAVVSDGNRGGPFYYAGIAGQIVLIVAALVIRYPIYSRLARLRMRKVVGLYAAGSAALDEPAAAWLAGQRRLVTVHAWSGALVGVTLLPVFAVMGVAVFGHHDDPGSSPVPYGIGILAAVAVVLVFAEYGLVYRRIAWDEWVWGSPERRSSRTRPAARGIPLGAVAALAAVAAVGWAVGTVDPVHGGPGPTITPPVIPSVPVPHPPPLVPTLPSFGVPSVGRLPSVGPFPSFGPPSTGG